MRTLAFSPKRKWLASAGDDRQVRLWDVTDRHAECSSLAGHTASVFSIAFSPDGKTLFTGATDKTPMPGHAGEVYGLAFSPDGLTLVSVGRDRTARVWDPLTAQEILTLKGHDSAVRCAAFSPDGTILATGSDDGAIRLWRAPGSPK